MNKRENFIKSKEYIVSQIQLNLLNLIGNYKDKKHLKDYQLADELGVTKGYVSQILNATFDHKISKIADLSLVCNAVPLIFYVSMDEYLQTDREDKIYKIFPVVRPRELSYNSVKVSSKVGKSESEGNIDFEDKGAASSYPNKNVEINISEYQFSVA